MSTFALPSSSTPLWGQAYELIIDYAPNNGPKQVKLTSNTWEPEALRITFEVLQAANTAPIWHADISVYNMDPNLAQDVVLAAVQGNVYVTLKAGFQTGPNQMGVIWSSTVFQGLFTREGVVDQKLTLHCVAFPAGVSLFPQSFSMGVFSSQQKLVAKMIQGANLPPLGPANQGRVAAQRMQATQYPRGNTVFGTLPRYLTQVADSNGVQTWFDGLQVYVAEAASGKRAPDLIYSPPFPPGGVDAAYALPDGTTSSIIGTPVQTQQGVDFTVLLDPRLKVTAKTMIAQLVRTQINQLAVEPLSGNLPFGLASPNNSNLTFFVTQVRHTGDTRGNIWQTDVTGWSTAYADSLLTSFGGGA